MDLIDLELERSQEREDPSSATYLVYLWRLSFIFQYNIVWFKLVFYQIGSWAS